MIQLKAPIVETKTATHFRVNSITVNLQSDITDIGWSVCSDRGQSIKNGVFSVPSSLFVDQFLAQFGLSRDALEEFCLAQVEGIK